MRTCQGRWEMNEEIIDIDPSTGGKVHFDPALNGVSPFFLKRHHTSVGQVVDELSTTLGQVSVASSAGGIR